MVEASILEPIEPLASHGLVSQPERLVGLVGAQNKSGNSSAFRHGDLRERGRD